MDSAGVDPVLQVAAAEGLQVLAEKRFKEEMVLILDWLVVWLRLFVYFPEPYQVFILLSFLRIGKTITKIIIS